MNPTYPSTKKQRQLIAIGCQKLGIPADLRHDMLMERFKQDSSTKITHAQAKLFLNELSKMGFDIQPGAGVNNIPRNAAASIKRDGKTIRLVSRAEMDKISALAGLIEWKFENGLELWMKKRLHIDKVRTAGEAWLVIEGLKKMFENHMKKTHGPAWWTQQHDNPDVMIYIHEHCPEEYR